MLTEELKERIRSLSSSEFKEVVAIMAEENRRRIRYRLEDRTAELIGVMTECIGRPIGERRDYESSFYRSMITYQLRREGFSLKQVANALGRHHTTIFYKDRKWADALDLPQMYSDVMPVWNKFQMMIAK